MPKYVFNTFPLVKDTLPEAIMFDILLVNRTQNIHIYTNTNTRLLFFFFNVNLGRETIIVGSEDLTVTVVYEKKKFKITCPRSKIS